jgi:hypothetical protein
MRSNFRNVGLATLVCSLIGACAPETAVVKLYENPEQQSKTYKRLLIVDVASNHSDQQLFENAIVTRLKQEQVEAIPSYTMLDTSEGVTQEKINEVGDWVEADGILVVHIASLDTTMDTVKGRENLKITCRGGDPVDFFLYDHEFIKEPDSVKMAHTVAVISNLYDGDSHERVWSIQSTCFEKASMPEVVWEEAIAITRQLRLDKLID